MHRRTTSHDVARLAGVSQSTVSLVLNGRMDMRISEPTRRRVLEAAEQLHYTRNATAYALQTGHTHRIGIVPIHPRAFTDDGHYYHTLMNSFVMAAFEQGYNLLLHSSSHASVEDLRSDILGHSADGVILIGRATNDPLTLALLRARFPAVTVSWQPDANSFHSVDCDNEQGGRLAAEHLLRLGHRRIGMVAPILTHSWEMQRFRGAEQAISAANSAAPVREPSSLPDVSTGSASPLLQSIRWHPHAPATDVAAALCEMDDLQRPTALICQGERQAADIAAALRERGLDVPTRISLIAFNSNDFCDSVDPPLTAVGQPLADIGAAAVEMLTDMLAGKEVSPGTRRFPMYLDIRQSCGIAPTSASR